MAVAQGYGKTVTSGSVFAYDVADTRNSYIGQPTTNLANTNTARTMFLHYGSHAMTFADAPEKGDGWKKVTITTVNGGNDRLSQFPYITSAIGQRTYSVEYDVGTLNTYKWKIDGTAGQTIIPVTGKGKFQFTVTHGSVGSFALFLINQTPATGLNDTVYYRYYQVEDKPTATPFTPGTRSATQGLLPLVGNSTLDLSGTSFNSNAQIAFDGTDDYLTIGNFTNKPITAITCEAVIKPTKPSVGTGTIRGGAISSGNSMYLGIIDSTDGGNTFSMHWANQTNSSRVSNWNGQITNNAWSHLVGTYDGTTARAYLNGVEIWSTSQSGTIPDATYYIATYGGTIVDGTHNFNGEIPVAKIYNRALSAAEVGQNYRHYKTRFNLS